MGKKRRCEVDLDAERTLYTSFVQAANSISQLYTSAVQQQRRASAAASRQTLVGVPERVFLPQVSAWLQSTHPGWPSLPCCPQERVLGFLLREYGSTDAVPKAALMQFLQQEYEASARIGPCSCLVSLLLSRPRCRPLDHHLRAERGGKRAPATPFPGSAAARGLPRWVTCMPYGMFCARPWPAC